MEACDDGIVVGQDRAVRSKERNGSSIGAKKKGCGIEEEMMEVDVGKGRVLNQGAFPMRKGGDMIFPGKGGGLKGRWCKGDRWKWMDSKGVSVVGEIHRECIRREGEAGGAVSLEEGYATAGVAKGEVGGVGVAQGPV